MNQRACLYFQNRSEALVCIRDDTSHLCHFSNKYRLCLLLGDEQDCKIQLGPDSVFTVREALTCFMTYELHDGKLRNPDRLLVSAKSSQIWCQDIDLWIGFPDSWSSTLSEFCEHSHFYTFEEMGDLLK